MPSTFTAPGIGRKNGRFRSEQSELWYLPPWEMLQPDTLFLMHPPAPELIVRLRFMFLLTYKLVNLATVLQLNDGRFIDSACFD